MDSPDTRPDIAPARQELLKISTEVLLIEIRSTKDLSAMSAMYVAGYGPEWAWTTAEPLQPPYPENPDALRAHVRALRRVILVHRSWPPVARYGDLDAIPDDVVDDVNPAIRGLFDALDARGVWPEITARIVTARRRASRRRGLRTAPDRVDP